MAVNIKNNLQASAAPQVTDDSSAGYSIGSVWRWPSLTLEWVCISASVGAAVWSLKGTSTGWTWPKNTYAQPDYITSWTDQVATADILCMIPLRVHQRTEIDRIAAHLTTAQASAAVRYGIYPTDLDTGLPDGQTLVSGSDSGEIDLSSGSDVTKPSTVSGVFLTPGVWWLAHLVKSTGGTQPTLKRISGNTTGALKSSAGLVDSSSVRFRGAAQAYGALPSTCPVTALATGNGLVMGVRRRNV